MSLSWGRSLAGQVTAAVEVRVVKAGSDGGCGVTVVRACAPDHRRGDSRLSPVYNTRPSLVSSAERVITSRRPSSGADGLVALLSRWPDVSTGWRRPIVFIGRHGDNPGVDVSSGDIKSDIEAPNALLEGQ